MRYLVFRDDCSLLSGRANFDNIIHSLMNEYALNWDTQDYDEHIDSDRVYEFARKLIHKIQDWVNTAPVVGTDEAIAVKCPECKNVYIEYNNIYNSFCPTCGTKFNVEGKYE